MARLERSEVQDLLENRTIDETLVRARRQDRRLKLHVEPHTTSYKISRAYYEFLSFVKSIIVKDKYLTFKDMIRFPLPTTEVAESIFSKAEKIFDAEGGFMKFNFTNPELEQDFEQFRKTQDVDFWRSKGFQTFKSAVNSFLVVDLPVLEFDEEGLPIQETRFPEPYYNVISAEDIIHVVVDEEEQCEYIIFLDPTTGLYIQMDDFYYRIYEQNNSGFQLISEITHDLNYTPARSFWSQRISNDCYEKMNILTPSLGRLDWLLSTMIGRDHLEAYGIWPLLAAIEQHCDYKDDFGNECESGRIGYHIDTDEGQQLRYKDCPKCAERKLFGPGTIIDVPARASNDEPDMLEAARYIEAPVETLENIDKKIEAKINSIIYNSVGVVSELREAVNELQVVSIFEDRETVLNNIIDNFEKVNKWAIDTKARLRYGESFIDSIVKYGRKVFLLTPAQLKEVYHKARDSGLPSFELENIRQNIYSASYKNNPNLKRRIQIMSNLEPYQELSIAELTSLIENNQIISQEDLVLKLNFASFIKRFEREEGDIVEFRNMLDFDLKIELIKDKLNEYVTETIERIGAQTNPPAAEDGSGEDV